MRARWLVLAGVLGAMTAVVPALGADGTVMTSGTTFSPATVTINVGEQVTFTNGGGSHNVHFDDRVAPENPLSTAPWTVSRRFDAAGSFPFYCDQHGGPGSSGMSGVVTVQAPPPGGTTPPPGGTTPPPGGTTPPPTGTTPAPGGAAPPAVAPGFGARLVRSRFCARKSATCKRPGIGIRVSAQESLVVTGALERRPRGGKYRASGRIRFRAAKGNSTVTVLRRTDRSRIGAGEYRLTLTAVRAAPSSDGTRSAPVVLRFSVRR